jgi:hypothetical protein
MVDGVAVGARERIYVMLNKPRGHVTTTADERGRDTVYALFADAGLPWIAPVGRLDKASEGLLLFSNDSEWAARITSPESTIDKTYHVQIDRLPDEALIAMVPVSPEKYGTSSSTRTRCGPVGVCNVTSSPADTPMARPRSRDMATPSPPSSASRSRADIEV